MDENRKQIMEDLFKFSDKLGLGLTFSPTEATIKLDAGNMKSFLGLIGKVFDVDLDNSKYSKDYVEFLGEISKNANWKGGIDEDLKKLDDSTDEFWELFKKKFCNKVEKLASEKNLEKVDADKKESQLESVESASVSEKESGATGECGLRATCTDACSECDEKKAIANVYDDKVVELNHSDLVGCYKLELYNSFIGTVDDYIFDPAECKYAVKSDNNIEVSVEISFSDLGLLDKSLAETAFFKFIACSDKEGKVPVFSSGLQEFKRLTWVKDENVDVVTANISGTDSSEKRRE